MKRFLEFLQTSLWVFRLYWRISPGLLLTALVTQILSQLQTLVYAFIFGLAIDRVVALLQAKVMDTRSIALILALFVGNYFVFSIIGLINNRAISILSNRDIWYLRKYLSDHLVTLGLAKLEDPDLTNKATRFNEIVGTLNQHMQMLTGLVSLLITMIASAVVVSIAVPVLTPIFVIFSILKFSVNQKYIGLLWAFNRKSTEDRRRAAATINMLSDPASLKEIIVTHASGYLGAKYMTVVNWITGEFKKLNLEWSRYEFLQSIGDGLLYALGLYFIITKGIQETLTIGSITFLIRSVGSFYDQLDSLSYRIARARESAIRLKDAQELFENYLPEQDGMVVLENHKAVPSLEFRNVTFAYPHSPHPIFKNLNLVIKPEEKLAIVGINGAGKTTLVKLIARLYRVNEGAILIDGKNINDIAISSWYKKLGVLFQDFNTYGYLTVEENVGVGRVHKGGINRKRVERALQEAEATAFVNDYPDKTSQVLSEQYKGGDYVQVRANGKRLLLHVSFTEGPQS